MTVDLKRLAAVAVDTAFHEDRAGSDDSTLPIPRGGSRHGPLRGLAAGAALVAVARFAAKRAPSPVDLAERFGLGELGDRVRDRLDDWFGEEDSDDYEDEPDDYEDEEEEEPEDDEELDEPVAEEEEEQDEDPEADADFDDEQEAEDDEDFGEDDEEPNGQIPWRLDPASRPPKPPGRKKAKTG